jgi:hypothetical protein
LLSPNDRWSKGYNFKVHGRLDSDYAMNSDDCRSISCGRVFVDGIPLAFHSVTKKVVMLSLTEAKMVAAVMVAQDMLYVY